MAIPVVSVDGPHLEMPTFRCWGENSGSEETADVLRAWDPHLAAESFASERWNDNRAEQQLISVRDGDGKTHRFLVHLEMVPWFHAHPIDDIEAK
jgi:hypothetical protein